MRAALAITCLATACTSAAPDPTSWTARYSPESAYINRSNIAVTAFSEPKRTSELVGSVAPGEGGFISACSEDGDWCKISLPVLGTSGWVKMTSFFPSDI